MTTPDGLVKDSPTGLEPIFGPGGALSRTRQGFEHRPGQQKMALAVQQALEAPHHLVVEAGTGVGKTLAYLVPTLGVGGKVILSTGTKALQDQLVEREMPMAMRATGLRRRVELLKGRENYLCLKRVDDAEVQPVLTGTEEIPVFRNIREWARTTGTGDRAEVPGLPDRSRLWSRLDARGDTCTGSQCPFYDRCFLFEARRRAQQADLVVANHHLLFADLALRLGGEGQILPDARFAILDEAHLATDAAVSHFGLRLSLRMVADLARDAEAELQRLGDDALPARDLARWAKSLFRGLRPPAGQARVRLELRRLDGLEGELEGLKGAWAALADAVSGSGPRGEERALVAARCQQQSATLKELLEGRRIDRVVTCEPQGKQGAIVASWPIEVGPLLQETLASAFDAVIATSATLSVARRLERACQRLGLDDAERLIVASPFDHRRQAALYVPRDFPEPRDPSFTDRCLEQILELLQITQGRALVLFASHRALEAAAERLQGALDWPVLVQGQAPRERLVEAFREQEHSVLLGTASFRQGIDVPGQALSLVIVDKLPFAVPDDPLVAARADAIRRRGGNPFMEDSLPEAIIALKQALGRLIRSRKDHGLLALLDVRVRTRRYGDAVLASLSPWPLLDEIDQARRWFRSP